MKQANLQTMRLSPSLCCETVWSNHAGHIAIVKTYSRMNLLNRFIAHRLGIALALRDQTMAIFLCDEISATVSGRLCQLHSPPALR